MLRLTSKGVVRFSWADDAMEALFTLNPNDTEEELMDKLTRMLGFVQDRRTPLPVRTPGLALEMAQMGSPALREAPPAVGNGWAAMAAPELPERLQGEVEFIPPGEEDA